MRVSEVAGRVVAADASGSVGAVSGVLGSVAGSAAAVGSAARTPCTSDSWFPPLASVAGAGTGCSGGAPAGESVAGSGSLPEGGVGSRPGGGVGSLPGVGAGSRPTRFSSAWIASFARCSTAWMASEIGFSLMEGC